MVISGSRPSVASGESVNFVCSLSICRVQSLMSFNMACRCFLEVVDTVLAVVLCSLWSELRSLVSLWACFAAAPLAAAMPPRRQHLIKDVGSSIERVYL